MSNLTVVTGIWDLKRDEAGEGFKRPFSHYLDRFIELLKTDLTLVIFIEKKYEDVVWKYRQPFNTKVYIKEVDEFREKFDGYSYVQKIRKNEKWLNQTGWLKDSTQATLELYNPMVMSKMFMLHDVSIYNPFNTEYFIWLDGGITNTVHQGYFTHDKILDKITPYLNKFFFISFPYETTSEIHGFDYKAMLSYSRSDVVNYVCRAGLFGGHKDYISKANGLYYGLLMNSLMEGYMGTEESIFTIMSYLEPSIYQRYMIEPNGLINRFCEALKNDAVVLESVKKQPSVALYVISFNSPEQFEVLVNSWKNNSDYINITANYLLDNSTDLTTTDKYKALCKQYNFTHIKKDNIGICGGRQFVAEHFHTTQHDYYVFLEDDMLLNDTPGTCVNNFVKTVPDMYNNLLYIMIKENYDFLKISFTEFFGDNKTQWAWYNVPQSVREKVWPEKPKLPEHGLDPDAPLTRFKNIKNLNGITYIDGEIYYCNWPQIVSRKGNYKMFLETKWGHPFEQTWMSHMFQLTLEGKLKPALLLASPITHYRFDHYDSKLRKES